MIQFLLIFLTSLVVFIVLLFSGNHTAQLLSPLVWLPFASSFIGPAGEYFLEKEKYPLAEKLLLIAVAIDNIGNRIPHNPYAAGLHLHLLNLSQLCRDQGRNQEALEYSRAACTAMENGVFADFLARALALKDLSLTLTACGEFAEAEAIARKSKDISASWPSWLGGDPSAYMPCYALAKALINQEKFAQAEEAAHEAWISVSQPEVPRWQQVDYRDSIGVLLTTALAKQSKYSRELHIWRELVSWRRQTQQENPDAIATALTNQAQSAMKCSLFDEAETALNEVVQIAKENQFPEEATAEALANLGDLMMRQRRFEEAHKYTNDSLALAERCQPRNEDLIASNCLALGKINSELSQKQAAEQFFKKAISIYEQLGSEKTSRLEVSKAEYNLLLERSKKQEENV